MRKGVDAAPTVPAGTAPAPPKNRAATLENTARAVKPWKLGTLTRPAYPGIFDRSHSMGNVIGVPEHTEVIGVVGVFPNVLAGKHHIASESLLEAGVEFVAPARAE